MQTENGGPGDEPDFDSVFAREDVEASHDSEAESVASDAPQSRDEKGRFMSLHGTPVEEPAQAEPEPAKEAAPQAEQKKQEASQPEATDPASPSRTVPLPELLSEREKRQEAQRQIAELQGQLQAFQQMAQQRPPQPQQEQQPDWYASPEQAAQAMQQTIQNQFTQQIYQTRLVLSEQMLRAQHSDYDEVSRVFADQAQNDQNLLRQLFEHPAPAQFAYQVGRQIQLMSKIGNDPSSYEARIREEERQKVLAELKAGGVNGKQEKPVFPGSLATATQTGRQGGHLDPQTAADSVFARG